MGYKATWPQPCFPLPGVVLLSAVKSKQIRCLHWEGNPNTAPYTIIQKQCKRGQHMRSQDNAEAPHAIGQKEESFKQQHDNFDYSGSECAKLRIGTNLPR